MTKIFYIFGTIGTISFDSNKFNEIIDIIINKLNKLDKELSIFREDSIISKINNNSGNKYVQVSQDVLDITKFGIKYGHLTHGALDITINSINKNLINYKKISVHERKQEIRFKKKGMKIDFGSLAKGYATDFIIDLLNIYGVDDALIDLGGNVFVKGKNEGILWKVGIQTPFGKQLESAGYIELSNKSIVTSGLYERGNHIINPINGLPVDNEIASVSIISDKSIDGEGLSTSCFVLGIKKGGKLLNKIKNIDYIILTKEKKIICSNNLIDKFKITNKEYSLIEKR